MKFNEDMKFTLGFGVNFFAKLHEQKTDKLQISVIPKWIHEEFHFYFLRRGIVASQWGFHKGLRKSPSGQQNTLHETETAKPQKYTQWQIKYGQVNV